MTASSPPDQPRVTVVLPVWNAGDYLAAAVESIRAQTVADWELLAIDDGSTDGSRQTLEDFARSDRRIVVTSRPNRGLAATLQEGIDRARSGIVALMNADDISHPDRLARQLAFLERHPTVAALGTANAFDGVASFSSRGPQTFGYYTNGGYVTVAGVRAAVDLAAPGESLTSAFYGGQTGGNNTSLAGSVNAGTSSAAYSQGLDGTSFAAPIVAGGAAQFTPVLQRDVVKWTDAVKRSGAVAE
jgi:glycosyltransferase involved in cell wall biosynthesis